MNTYLDFIIAVGIFLSIFGVSISFVNGYFVDAINNNEDRMARNLGFDILNALENEDSWGNLSLVGKVYKFHIEVNNSNSDISNELIKFDLSDMGYSDVDFDSVRIYENKDIVNYEKVGSEYRFSEDFDSGEFKMFTVWFDEDSSFDDVSVSLSNTTDNLTETIIAPVEVRLMEYKKIKSLNKSNYTQLKEELGTTKDFNLKLGEVLDFGPKASSNTDVHSLQKHVLYQNQTGYINSGDLVINIW